MVDSRGMSGTQSGWPLAVCVGLAILAAATVCARAQTGDAIEPTASRVVHRFDFDEPQNYDSVPSYWTRFPDPAFADPQFPRFAEGYFDPEIGHDAQPSFYLESKGRCVAYRYDGPATRIRPGDYMVTGWIKPDRIAESRAAVSAYYLDWEGRYIESTQVFSRLVGGESVESNDGWQRIRIHLPKAPEDAQFVGVTCWIVQQTVWQSGNAPHRHIFLRDVSGGAWFDDIAVLGLPRALIESEHEGNVVVGPSRTHLRATVSDDTVDGLTSALIVRDRMGEEVYRVDVTPHAYEEEQAELFVLPPLAAGLYRATLAVSSDSVLLLEQHLTFAVVHALHLPRGYVAGSMGCTFEQASRDGIADQLALVRNSSIGAAKLPLWTGDPTRPGYDIHRDALHELLDQMIESRLAVVGVLAGPPADMVRSVGPYARSLLDILSEDPEGWRSHLDAIVAPYASILTTWQIGGDGDPAFAADVRVASGLQAVRDVMRTMVTAPHLTTVGYAGDVPADERLPANNLSITLPNDVRPDFVGEHIAPYRALGYERLWVSMGQPATATYDEDRALGEWALRITEARWAGADTVFVPQPWTTRQTLYRNVIEPTSAFVVYRTLIDAIGDATPATRLEIGPSARGVAFNHGGSVTLVLWDPEAPDDGVDYILQMGAATEAMDLWGRPIPLVRGEDGRHRVHLTPSPVYVLGVEPWLVAFRSGMSLSPERTQFAVEAQRHALTVTNPYVKPLSGLVVMEPPPGWEIEPKRMQFSLEAGQSVSLPLDVRHPHNESAGMKTIRAHINLLSGRKYALDVPLELELGLNDLDVWGYSVTDANGIVAHHGVTNRSTVPLSFQTFAVYPGRSRQYRVIQELLPGQTLSVEYRFPGLRPGTGRRIRLGLREVNGPRIHNLEIATP